MVKRDGEWKVLEVRELVPGDVIELKGGDVIPGDAVVGTLLALRHMPMMPWHNLQDKSCCAVESR